ncbi:LuxR C-terminal-related transcriptional regulator [Modestobacter marinus]|uniref:LuxR C-terminal-related transcriptional regulator n=1 Tax=Modestobacter marinus TaxID=477641 RepID=UPI001C947DA7|nr:LuxR C-terminal-related transcriptional regulator [Modestobacter marinus]
MGHVSRSKTAVPRLPPEFVHRPALVTALDRGEGRALTLVCAPPGYGKTLVLADWARRQSVACAWVTLNEEDDDPQRLWASVLAALTACPAVQSSSRLRRLVVPRTTVGVDFLTELIEALAAVPAQLRLVLDDAHHLRSSETLHGLQLLLRHRPTTIRLVLASRFDPPLPVARLRLEERLCELRTEQLSFTADETAILAGLCGLRLTGRQASVLHARTGGWVAGIRLAALALRGHAEPDLFLAAFTGDERPVADYLAGEVIANISDEECDLLRRTSISDPIPAPLAAELSGRTDAADVLSALERRTGLIVTSGAHRTEFRIQELVRSYLAADLYRHGPAQEAQLHRQAAEWWATQGRPLEALRHAARAADSTLVTALLHRWAPELVARGEHTELRRALAAAEGSTAATDDWLPLVSAQVHLAEGDLRAARADVRRAGPPGTDCSDRDLAHFRVATSRLVGMSGPGPEFATVPADPALAALVLAGRGAAGVAPDGGGRPADAAAALGDLETALAVARDQHLELLELQCLCLIGAAAATAGHHGRAAAAAAAAITAAAAHGWHDSSWSAAAHAVLAHASLMRADPAQALQVAVDGLRISPASRDPTIRFALRCARGGALLDLGDRTSGLLELQEAHAQLGGMTIPAPLAACASLFEYRAALLLGSSAAAATSMSRLAAGGGADAELTLMRAWSEAAAGTPHEARATVVPLLEGRLQPLLHWTVVEAWLIEVWAALRLNDHPGARNALQAALVRAEPLDTLRPFALAGHGLRVLLVDQLGGARDPSAFAFRCLSARQRVRQPSAPQLSAREQDVLAQLLSLSNLGEIAEDLEVSVNTIKSHVRAIYGKLGVSTRRTAVLTALERGLLT